jgi:putative ABC transport system permease protein
MRAIKRGFRSFHRHWVRNLVVVLLLFVCLTFSLSMLAVKLAADNQVQEVKASVGNYGEMKVSSDYQLQVFNQERSKTQAERSAEARSMTPEQQLEQRAQFLVPEAQTDAFSQASQITTYDKVLEARVTVSGLTNTELESSFSLRQRSGNQAGPAELSANTFFFEGNTSAPSASDFLLGNRVLSQGAFFTYQDYQKANPVVLIEKNLAESNNLHVGDSITALINGETGKDAEVPLKIIGTYETIQAEQQNQNQTFNPAGNRFFAPLSVVQKLNATPGYVQLGSYYFDNENSANAAQQAFDPDPVSISNTSTNKFEFVTDQADYQAISDPLTKVGKTSVIGLAGALGACALIILLAMAIIIGGRTRELGVLKAIGATNRQVMAQYAMEVICICLVAIILAMGTTAIISQSMGNWLLGNKTVTVNQSQTTQAGQQGPQNFRGGVPGTGNNGSLYKAGSSGSAANNQTSLQLNVVYQGSLFLYSILILVFIGLLGMAVPVIWITRLKPARVLSIE